MDTAGNKAARTEISGIKVVVPNMALRVIDRAIQAHGAHGRLAGLAAGPDVRRIRTLRFADGPDEVHRHDDRPPGAPPLGAVTQSGATPRRSRCGAGKGGLPAPAEGDAALLPSRAGVGDPLEVGGALRMAPVVDAGQQVLGDDLMVGDGQHQCQQVGAALDAAEDGRRRRPGSPWSAGGPTRRWAAGGGQGALRERAGCRGRTCTATTVRSGGSVTRRTS